MDDEMFTNNIHDNFGYLPIFIRSNDVRQYSRRRRRHDIMCMLPLKSTWSGGESKELAPVSSGHLFVDKTHSSYSSILDMRASIFQGIWVFGLRQEMHLPSTSVILARVPNDDQCFQPLLSLI